MSFAALAVVLAHIAMAGTAREPDEGRAAHIWQILMAGQLPFIAFFAAVHIPKEPRQGIPIFALQLLAGVAGAAPVFVLRL